MAHVPSEATTSPSCATTAVLHHSNIGSLLVEGLSPLYLAIGLVKLIIFLPSGVSVSRWSTVSHLIVFSYCRKDSVVARLVALLLQQ